MRKFRSYDKVMVERFRNDPKEADAFLEAAIKEFALDLDPGPLLLALRMVAEAKGGIPELASRLGIKEVTLDNVLSAQGNPEFDVFTTIVHELGYKFRLEPVA